MAWSKGRRRAPFKRRRAPTHWRELENTGDNAGAGLSRSPNEGAVVSAALENVYLPGEAAPTGTMCAPPYELTLDNDGTSASTEDHPRARLLRVVGMLRPVAIDYENEAETHTTSQGSEVRYAIVRLTSAVRKGEAFLNAASQADLPVVDLFQGQGLGSEGIAFLRSFLLPSRAVTDPVETGNYALMMWENIMQTLPWHKNAELSYFDLKSKRTVATASKMYLLRQVRRYDGSYIDPARILSARLYHADFARVLLGGRE